MRKSAKAFDPPIQPRSVEELENALHVIAGRWKVVILSHLFSAGVLRFSELHRAIVGISQKMLCQQLRDLERDGIVRRRVYPEMPPRVEYMLTQDGQALQKALEALRDWSASRTQLPATVKQISLL